MRSQKELNILINIKGGILSILCAFFGVARIFGGFLANKMWFPLFVIVGIGALFVNLKNTKFKVDYIGMFLVVYLFFNVIVTRPPSIFQSELRCLTFVFVLFVASSVLQNKLLRLFRRQCFNYLMLFFVGVSFVSFFCYFLGINWMIDQTTETDFYDSYTVTDGAGHFGGITNHSMTLGFISGVAVCYLLYKYYSTRQKKIIFLFICCLGTLFFTSSRIALGATIVGCITFIAIHSKSRFGFIKTILFLFVLFLISSPIWISAMAGIIAKQNSRGDIGEMGGRIEQIESRIEEFKDHPLIGIGFASVDPSKSHVGESGQIEPGSSWLTVLSMTGILGFTIILLFVFGSCKSLGHIHEDRDEKALLASLISFLIIHLFIEGYVFSGGSTLCFTLWLVLGVSRDFRYSSDKV